MTITEVATTLSVSEASVRNWIKTGYLNYNRNTGITTESFEHFRTNVAGKDKLTKRANKSLLDDHDHQTLISKTNSALENNGNPTVLAWEYENSLSNAYRNKEGIYYTPENICNKMFSDIPDLSGDEKFCDPCCGSGNFVMAAIRHGFLPENIYGYDTDPTAVEITKRRIYEDTGYNSENIICADFLSLSSDCDERLPEFDAILTNPPWGKKISKEEKVKLGNFLGAGRSLDTSSLFLFASMKSLKNGGTLALLMPESFFKIATFQDARRRLLDVSLISVRDFGKPFKGLLTKAQSFCATKLNHKKGNVFCCVGDRTFKRGQETFLNNPACIINFESSPDDASVISKLFGKPYVTLEGGSRWGLGIVTGNNKKFCKDMPGEDLMAVYKGVDIHKEGLNEPTTFIPKDLSLYQQVAPVELFEADEKILYRFISSNLVFYHDTEKSYFLNSVNMIVPADDFPISNAGITRLFNSDLFNWVFAKMFNTHKVLRADLEKMPLPVEFLKDRDDFTEEELLEYYGIERRENGTFRA